MPAKRRLKRGSATEARILPVTEWGPFLCDCESCREVKAERDQLLGIHSAQSESEEEK